MRHALEFFRKSTPTLREPVAEDGAEIWDLVRACKPLDENSMYCNLIQCDHFRETCVVAERVWQVAVAETARGTGLGRLMLGDLLSRAACRGVRRVQTTITADNEASWALFRRFAEARDGDFAFQAHYTQALHFRERHETEYMVTIDLGERMRRAA